MNESKRPGEPMQVPAETGVYDYLAERKEREETERRINERVDRFLEGFEADYRRRLADDNSN